MTLFRPFFCLVRIIATALWCAAAHAENAALFRAPPAIDRIPDVTYSLDGKTFAKPDQLTVQENGAARKARADEYKHIRWVFKTPLAAGGTATASFRAVLE